MLSGEHPFDGDSILIKNKNKNKNKRLCRCLTGNRGLLFPTTLVTSVGVDTV